MNDLFAMNDFVGFTEGTVKYSHSKDSDSDSISSSHSISLNEQYAVCKEKASEIISKVKMTVLKPKRGHRFSTPSASIEHMDHIKSIKHPKHSSFDSMSGSDGAVDSSSAQHHHHHQRGIAEEGPMPNDQNSLEGNDRIEGQRDQVESVSNKHNVHRHNSIKAKSHKISEWFKKETAHLLNPKHEVDYRHHQHTVSTDSLNSTNSKHSTFKWIQKLKGPSHHDSHSDRGRAGKYGGGGGDVADDESRAGNEASHFYPVQNVGLEDDAAWEYRDGTGDEYVSKGSINKIHEQGLNWGLNQKESGEQDKDLVSGLTIYHMNVTLKRGEDLAIRDYGGSSDPYVKIKLGPTTVYRSKVVKANLNPCWDENVIIPLESMREARLEFQVFDYDRATQDDFMGSAICDCRQISIGVLQDFELELKESGNQNYLGKIYVTVLITPNILDEKDSRIISLRREAQKNMKHQIWSSTVTVVVLEGKDFSPRANLNEAAVNLNEFSNPNVKQDKDTNGKSVLPQKVIPTEATKDNKMENNKLVQAPLNLFVKLQIGPEKGKTKVSPLTLTPQWRERFYFHLYPDENQTLLVALYNKPVKKPNELLGETYIDLAELPPDITNVVWKSIEQGPFNGAIKLMVVVSGCKVGEKWMTSQPPTNTKEIEERYSQSIWKSFYNFNHVGYLIVKVHEARHLTAVDIGGTSDPFCVLELGNIRLQTQTLYKTLSPEWNKTFVFDIHDIFTNFELNVMDENKNTKMKFLGKLIIPLLSIENGVKRWFKLKDELLKEETKGEILLEMLITYNTIKACLVAFTPKEEKILAEPPSFNKNVFIENVNRTKSLVVDNMAMFDKLPNILNWENPKLTLLVLMLYQLGVYYFHPCMIPLCLIGGFVKGYIAKQKGGYDMVYDPEAKEIEQPEQPEESNDQPKKESSKKSIKDTIQSIQDTCQSVQNVLDTMSSYGERIKNIFNFTLPFLSYLAIGLLLLGFVLLYFVPIRWLLMAWGVNKFTKRLRSSISSDNNELLNFISRFPTDKEKQELKEFYVQASNGQRPSAVSSSKKIETAFNATLRSIKWTEKFQTFRDKFKKTHTEKKHA